MESVALFRELGHKEGLAEVLADFGIFCQIRGDYERASMLIEESLSLRREIGHTRGIAASLDFLGTVIYRWGDVRRASALWEESLVWMRAEDDPWRIAMVLAHVAVGALEQGDYNRARANLTESLTILRDLDERWQTAQTIETFACLAAVQGEQSKDKQTSLLRAAHLFGAAEAFREMIGAPAWPFQGQSYQRGIAILRAQLDETTLAAAWAEGRAMTFDQMLAYALNQTV